MAWRWRSFRLVQGLVWVPVESAGLRDKGKKLELYENTLERGTMTALHAAISIN